MLQKLVFLSSDKENLNRVKGLWMLTGVSLIISQNKHNSDTLGEVK